MSERVCPVWIGYLLASPVRKIFENPDKLLAPFVKPGMRVLEVGPGMGFFTLPMARMVGAAGRVVSVDVQQGMLDRLRKRAAKAGVLERLDIRLCPATSLGIADLGGTIDFILLFAVVHEVMDKENLFSELASAARPGCRVYFAEPSGHVSGEAFCDTLRVAIDAGFSLLDRVKLRGSKAAVLSFSGSAGARSDQDAVAEQERGPQ